MTRRWFFQALAGATALLSSAKRMMARPKPPMREALTVNVAEGLPIKLGVADRIILKTAYTPSAEFRIFLVVEADRMTICYPFPSTGLPMQHLFIADREYRLTELKVLTENGPAPILWMKTSAGE